MKARDGLNAWIVCLIASLFFFDELLRMNIFNSLQQDFNIDIGLNSKQYSQIAACYFYGNVIMLFPAGIMLDRLSVRNLLALVSLLCGLASLLMSVAHSMTAILIARLIIGLGGAFALLTVFKLATRWFSENKLAFVMGSVVTFGMIGGLMAQTPFILLKHMIGWRSVLMLDAGFGIVIALLVLKFVKDYPKGHKFTVAEDFSFKEFFKLVKLAGSNVHTWLAGFSISLLNLPIFIFGAIWGLPYLMQYHALTDINSSLVVSMMFVGMIVGSPILGAWSDNYMIGRGFKIIKKKNRPQVMFLSAIIMIFISCLLIFHGAWNLNYLLLIFFMLGFFSAGQVVGYPYISENNPQEIAATAGGISSTIIMSGGIVQPFFGWLLNLTGDMKFINHSAIYSNYDYQLALKIIPASCFVVIILTSIMAAKSNK